MMSGHMSCGDAGRSSRTDSSSSHRPPRLDLARTSERPSRSGSKSDDDTYESPPSNTGDLRSSRWRNQDSAGSHSRERSPDRSYASGYEQRGEEAVSSNRPMDTITGRDDVGSPSDISEQFGHICGNTDLANAQVLLLGEIHIDQHEKAIVNFINRYAKKDDIVLVEGYQASSEVNPIVYALHKAFNLGKNVSMDLTKDNLIKWKKEGVIRLLRKDIKIYGWDDLEKASDQLQLFTSEETDDCSRQFSLLKKQRDEKMLETIHSMRENFPDKKIFVIAGKGHFQGPDVIAPENLNNQRIPYIALTPNYESTEKDKEAFTTRFRQFESTMASEANSQK